MQITHRTIATFSGGKHVPLTEQEKKIIEQEWKKESEILSQERIKQNEQQIIKNNFINKLSLLMQIPEENIKDIIK